jgi:hypothetical protein
MMPLYEKYSFHRKCRIDKSIHKINTRLHNRLHVSSARLSIIQRGVYYTSIRIFNNMPHNLHTLKDNVNVFKRRLKDFLILKAFYSIDEYMANKEL